MLCETVCSLLDMQTQFLTVQTIKHEKNRDGFLSHEL